MSDSLDSIGLLIADDPTAPVENEMTAQPLTERTRDYPDEDGRLYEAWVVDRRDADSRRPTVILTHDWSGFNAGMKVLAREIAAAGWRAFGLDVYGKGVRGDETGDNSRLMNPLLADRARLRRRLLAGYDAVLADPHVDPARIAVLGWCFGGLCALDLARAGAPGLAAAISVHGVLTPPTPHVEGSIAASILVLHGWDDPMAPRADLVAFADEMTLAGADWQIGVYGHAMHAFTFEGAQRPDLGIAYHAPSARRARARITQFLEECIGPGERVSRAVDMSARAGADRHSSR